MRTAWVAWFVPIVGVVAVVACGSSDSDSKKKQDPTGGAGGEDPQGGASGTGRGGTGTGGTGTGGTGTGGDGGEGATTGGSGPTGGSSGDAGAGGETGGTNGGAGTGGEGGGTTIESVILTIDSARDIHAISPRIYGINRATMSCSDANARFGACRLGGNPWSTYNWENNASNAGADRCHENNDALGASATPAAPVTALLAEAGTASAAAIVTVPMLANVAADKTAGTAPPACGGDVRNSANYLTTRFKANRARKGSALVTTPDTADGFVNQDEFVNFVRTTAPTVPLVFALDNQPDLWAVTHPVVHAAKATYAEVVAKTVEFASMVRDTAPTAEISSYVGYGYNGFLNLQEAPDAASRVFIDYFLASMSTESTNAGRRLIDYLDVHWYPDIYVGADRVISDVSSPAMVAARVQAPRSLWDSTYLEDSWITQTFGNPVRLVPWLKEKIATNYAGTKLAVSEWNYGGGTHVSGAVAAADALGVFGREGVELAAFASLTNDDPFVVGAFRAFRNYDGSGAAFGDRSIRAASSDQALVSVYASVESTNAAAMVIVAINKSNAPVDATIDITHDSSYTSASVYRITSSSAIPQVAAGLTVTNPNELAYRMPAYSVSVIVPRT